MGTGGRKNILEPTRINRYNKFLSNLDNKNNNLNNNNISKFDEMKQNIKTEEDIKREIDNLIEIFTLKFHLNDHSSKYFNGQFVSDINENNVHNPNFFEYPFISNQNCKHKHKHQKNVANKIIQKDTFNEPNKFITIDTEINNIGDILKLVEKYKLDPTIHYNINIKALHDIKEPLEELNNMIGMNSLKTNIVDQIIYFIQELHLNNNSGGDFMHTVIYGPPGTGKTEIAKIMGKIYSKIGLLKSGTFKKVTRSDLIAGYLGQTALKTRDVINDALGGVLFIDEAYALGNIDKRDSFSKECIDTLCEALSDNKENLMVIIAGYEKELKECFFNYNQGLDSRFTWRFKTDNYSHEDLYNIFIKKIKDIGWELDENSEITSEWFKKNKNYLKFYGRDIETILAKTKIAHSRRVFCKHKNEKKKLKLIDLDKGFEIYINNNDIKSKLEEENNKKQLYHTLYC